MKITICVIFFLALCYSGWAIEAPSARLLIPHFNEDIQPWQPNSIFLPAYSVELLRLWPKDLHPYIRVISGAEKTWVVLQWNTKKVKVRLQEALHNKWVDVFSITATTGRNRGVMLECEEGKQLISLRTDGMVLADSSNANEPFSDTALFRKAAGGYSLNEMYGYTYAYNQQLIWHAIVDSLLRETGSLIRMVSEYRRQILLGSGMLPPYYQLTQTDDHLFIKAANIPFDPGRKSALDYNDDGQPYWKLADLIDQLKQEIADQHPDSFSVRVHFSPDRKSLDSIVIKGNYKGMIPLNICYMTDQKVMLTGSFPENIPLVTSTTGYKVSLGLYYDFGDDSTLCRIPFPSGEICLPSPASEFVVDACSVPVRTNWAQLSIGL